MAGLGFRRMLSIGAMTLLGGCGSGDSTPASTPTESIPTVATSGSATNSSNKTPAERMGLDEKNAGYESIDAVISGSGYSLIGAIVTPFKGLPHEDRAEIVRGLALCMQAYYQSDAFTKDYSKIRLQRMPQPTVYEQTPQQELDASLVHDREQVEEARKNVLPMLPAENRAEVERSYEDTEKMLADPQMQQYRLMGIEAERAQRQADYEKSLQQWQETFPEAPKPIIVRRLREFLALTDAIDFDAKLIDAPGGKKKFENPEYERKPWDWKWAYRAGEDSVAAAREVAKSWLDELE